jgi:hypothetical protein
MLGLRGSGAAGNWRGGRVVRPVFLVALTAALLSPGLWLGPGFDGAVYTLAGVVIRNGRMPYTDLFDNKPPGLYVLNAIGQAVMPWFDPWVVSWLLTFVFTAAAVLVVDRLLRRRMSPIASFLMCLVCVIGVASHPIAYGGGLTESFAILPLVASLWAVSTLESGRRTAACVGCLASLACLFSVHAVPVAAILVVAAMLVGARPRDAARRALAALAAGAVVPLAVAGWLAARGTLGAAVDQVLVYNISYRAASAGFGYVLPATCLILGCLAVPVAIAVVRMVRDPRAFDRVSWLCLAWALAEVATLGYENRLFLHYLILLVPPTVLLSGPGFEWLLATIRSSSRGSRNAAILLAAVTACMFVVSATSVGGLTGITMDSAGKAEAVTDKTSAWIRANTPVPATVFLWGNDTYIYLVADRSSYDRHVYQYPMVTAGYWSPDKTAALLSAWSSAPPAVIVETPATVAMFRPQPDPAQPPNYDTLAPLRDFVRAHYRLEATFGDGGDVEDIYVLAATN